MFCYKCGTVLKDDALFCHKCGAKAIKDVNDSKNKDLKTYNNESKINNYKGFQNIDNNNSTNYFDCSDFEENTYKSFNNTRESNLSNYDKTTVSSASSRNESEVEEDLYDVSSDKGKIIIGIGFFSLIGMIIGEWLKINIINSIGIVLLILSIVAYIFYLIIAGNDKEKKIVKNYSKKAIGVICIFVVLIIAYVYFFHINPDILGNIIRPGVRVRDAYLTQYSTTVSIDKAFSNYFDNEKWDTYTKDGYSYVTFKGTCTYLEKEVDVCITFKITGENFVADGLDINGTRQSDVLLLGLLSNVYEVYDDSNAMN